VTYSVPKREANDGMSDEPQKTNWPVLILWIAVDCFIGPLALYASMSSATFSIATLACWLGVNYFCIKKLPWSVTDPQSPR
jgi:hypothetical protein